MDPDAIQNCCHMWQLSTPKTQHDHNIQGGSKKQAVDFLSEYVNKTEKTGGMSTNKNSYRENEVLSDIFT